jgi:MoaA/NifB/PqqE/SkfB family radical SAM enzyme
MFKLEDKIVYRLVDDKVVLYDLKKHMCYIFNETAFFIFEKIKENRSKEEILDFIYAHYNIEDKEKSELKIAIESFIEQLVSLGIIKVVQVLSLSYVKNDIEKEVNRLYSDEKKLKSAVLELTYKCSEKCKHCYIVDENKKELTTREVKNVLDQLKDEGVFFITFTGGDPFCRKDFMEILEYASSKEFIIDIFTNGQQIKYKDIIDMIPLNINCIHFSLYGAESLIHDEITRVNGSFYKTVESIANLRKCGFQVNVKMVVMENNYKQINKLKKLCQKLNVTLQLGISVRPKNDADSSPVNMRLKNHKNLLNIIKRNEDLLELDCGISKKDDSNICNGGITGLSINPYGIVYPCGTLKLEFGDLKKMSLKDILMNSPNRKKLLSLRTYDIKCSKNCKYKQTCVFCPGQAFLEKGDLISKYDEACLIAKIICNIKNRKEVAK